MFVDNQPETALFHCKLLSPQTFGVEYRPSTLPSPIPIPIRPVWYRISVRTFGNSRGLPSLCGPITRPMKRPKLSRWFGKCYGYPGILAFMEDELRADVQNEKTQSWIPLIKSALPTRNPTVNFSDGAAVLLTSEASFEALHPRLDSEKAIMEKFRPNIVVDDTTAWDEDIWGEVQFPRVGVKIILTSNCARC